MVVTSKSAGSRVWYDRDDRLPTIGGIPFLDDGFAHARLLAAVAAARHLDGRTYCSTTASEAANAVLSHCRRGRPSSPPR
jgi:hypothetical protein